MDNNELTLIEKARECMNREDYEQARILFEEALAAGDITAACPLGTIYYQGLGVDKDFKRAVKYYERGANNDDPACLANLGMCYYWGDGVEVNLELSAFYSEKAAKKGNIKGMFDTALNYQRGIGKRVDLKKTLFWLEKAAKNDNIDALVELGCIYQRGEYVQKDEKKAIDYFKKAANAGNHHAMLLLAPYYEQGLHLRKNTKKATQLYSEAYEFFYEHAAKGDSVAQLRLGNIYYYGGISLLDIPHDYAEAARWYEKAAKQGEPQAQIALANSYYFGIGAEQNYVKAAYWNQQAAEKNDPLALCNLASCYMLGRGVEKNEEKAAELFFKSANLGFPHAQVELGKCYLNARGVEQNYFYAFEWLKKACENGQRDASGYLGDCYLNGTGVDFDMKKAKELYRKGAALGDLESRIKLVEGYLCMMVSSNYHLREAKEILREICNEEENYRENQVPYIIYSDGMGRSFIENPLDSDRLILYGKAYFMLGVLMDKRGKRSNEAIRLFRMAEKLGYLGDDYDGTPAEHLETIIRETNHKYIKDTVDSYVEIRELTKKKAREERFQVIIHHADGSETPVKITGRDKLIYILCLMAAHESPRVPGITSHHFPYMKESLAQLAETLGFVNKGVHRWIDEFTYSKRGYQGYSTKEKEYLGWETASYSVALQNAKKHVYEACFSEEEQKMFITTFKGTKPTMTILALEPDQIIIPESLKGFLDALPTIEQLQNYKRPNRRIYINNT